MPPAISNIWLVGVTALRWGGDESKRVVGGLNGAGINGRLDSLVERYGVSTCSSTTSDSTVTKTLNGVIHGRTIELADDPGLNEGGASSCGIAIARA
ncbi:MAG: hypothetical protein NT069_29535 [Planctomycetota bacterium]|nr:hypothetical protein [Planctomycetota bacterium]